MNKKINEFDEFELNLNNIAKVFPQDFLKFIMKKHFNNIVPTTINFDEDLTANKYLKHHYILHQPKTQKAIEKIKHYNIEFLFFLIEHPTINIQNELKEYNLCQEAKRHQKVLENKQKMDTNYTSSSPQLFKNGKKLTEEEKLYYVNNPHTSYGETTSSIFKGYKKDYNFFNSQNIFDTLILTLKHIHNNDNIPQINLAHIDNNAWKIVQDIYNISFDINEMGDIQEENTPTGERITKDRSWELQEYVEEYKNLKIEDKNELMLYFLEQEDFRMVDMISALNQMEKCETDIIKDLNQIVKKSKNGNNLLYYISETIRKNYEGLESETEDIVDTLVAKLKDFHEKDIAELISPILLFLEQPNFFKATITKDKKIPTKGSSLLELINFLAPFVLSPKNWHNIFLNIINNNPPIEVEQHEIVEKQTKSQQKKSIKSQGRNRIDTIVKNANNEYIMALVSNMAIGNTMFENNSLFTHSKAFHDNLKLLEENKIKEEQLRIVKTNTSIHLEKPFEINKNVDIFMINTKSANIYTVLLTLNGMLHNINTKDQKNWENFIGEVKLIYNSLYENSKDFDRKKILDEIKQDCIKGDFKILKKHCLNNVQLIEAYMINILLNFEEIDYEQTLKIEDFFIKNEMFNIEDKEIKNIKNYIFEILMKDIKIKKMKRVVEEKDKSIDMIQKVVEEKDKVIVNIKKEKEEQSQTLKQIFDENQHLNEELLQIKKTNQEREKYIKDISKKVFKILIMVENKEHLIIEQKNYLELLNLFFKKEKINIQNKQYIQDILIELKEELMTNDKILIELDIDKILYNMYNVTNNNKQNGIIKSIKS